MVAAMCVVSLRRIPKREIKTREMDVWKGIFYMVTWASASLDLSSEGGTGGQMSSDIVAGLAMLPA
jgi:hypothetical protein